MLPAKKPGYNPNTRAGYASYLLVLMRSGSRVIWTCRDSGFIGSQEILKVSGQLR